MRKHQGLQFTSLETGLLPIVVTRAGASQEKKPRKAGAMMPTRGPNSR